MNKLIAIKTKKYSTVIGTILDRYGKNAEIRINKTVFKGSEVEELRHTWCTNRSICQTRDFELRINDEPLFGFHDHPCELWGALSEQEFLEQLRQRGVVRYRVSVVKESFIARLIKRLNYPLKRIAQKTRLSITVRKSLMKTDSIEEIRIDESGKLIVKPRKEDFSYIYRAAMEVNWNNDGKYLYSPKPKEWSYSMWFKQIHAAVKDEYGVTLKISNETRWENIDPDLKKSISNFSTNKV
jgi:hypothetical protein